METVVLWVVMGDRFWTDEGMYFLNDSTGVSIQIAMMIVHAGISVYFIRLWSKEWNAKISTMGSEKKNTLEYVRKEDSSIELLKKRYAMGEISKEEFEKMKKDMED